MNVTLYTTNCPQCIMLEGALKNKKLNFQTVYGEDAIRQKGYSCAPIMDVDGKTMSFAEAVRWVNAYENGGGSLAD